jgi:hypothetical protein
VRVGSGELVAVGGAGVSEGTCGVGELTGAAAVSAAETAETVWATAVLRAFWSKVGSTLELPNGKLQPARINTVIIVKIIRLVFFIYSFLSSIESST